MNREAISIEAPGLYETRKGERVRIVTGRLDPVHGLQWAGYIWRTASTGRQHRQWSDWPRSGLFGDAPAFDIVSYIGD